MMRNVRSDHGNQIFSNSQSLMYFMKMANEPFMIPANTNNARTNAMCITGSPLLVYASKIFLLLAFSPNSSYSLNN